MSQSLGDFDTSTVVYGKFTTYRPSTGAPHTLAGTPALSVYKDNSVTQSTAGITLTADFDSVTGFNHFAIDTSADGTFYAAGSFFDIVITTGTVDSVSAVGTVVGSFTLRKTSALKPTTAGRTLDVSAGGEAGVDWANVGTPGSTVSLSATTVGTATAVTTVNGLAANVITAAATAADFTTEVTAGLSTLDAAGVRSAVGLAAADLDTQLAALPTAAENADAIWDEARAGHVAAGSFGEGVASVQGNVTGSVASVTGAVGSVTAAVTVGTNNDKTGYRLSAAGVDDILDEALSEPAATFTWAGATLRTVVAWLGALGRNKMTQTSTTQSIRNDADSADISTSTHSDDGTTYTRGEWS